MKRLLLLGLVACLAASAALFRYHDAQARIGLHKADLRWRVANSTTWRNDSRLHPNVLGQDKMFTVSQTCTTMVFDASSAVTPPGISLTTGVERGGSAIAVDTLASFMKVTVWTDTNAVNYSSSITNVQLFVDAVPGGSLGGDVNPQGIQLYRKMHAGMGSKRAYTWHIPALNSPVVVDTAAITGDPGQLTATAPIIPHVQQLRGPLRLRFAVWGGTMAAARVKAEWTSDLPDKGQ